MVKSTRSVIGFGKRKRKTPFEEHYEEYIVGEMQSQRALSTLWAGVLLILVIELSGVQFGLKSDA